MFYREKSIFIELLATKKKRRDGEEIKYIKNKEGKSFFGEWVREKESSVWKRERMKKKEVETFNVVVVLSSCTSEKNDGLD